MNSKTKIYVFDCSLDKEGFDFRTAERNADVDIAYHNILIDEAEQRGSVYSLQGFQEAINNEELDLSNSFIYIK